MVRLRSVALVSTLLGLSLCGPGAATPGFAAGGPKTSLLISPFAPQVTNRLDPETGELGAEVGAGNFAVLSPDGDQVAYSRDIDPCTPEPEGCVDKGDLLVADSDGTGERVLFHNPLEAVRFVRWSPDGSALAFAEDGGPGDDAVLVVGADGTVLRSIPGAFGAAFAPDGTRLAFSDGSNIWVMDLASGATTPVTSDGTALATPPDWSHDGLHIAYAGNDDGLYVMNADGSGRVNSIQQFAGFVSFPNNPLFAPDDGRIAFTAEGSADFIEHVYVMDESGANPHVISDLTGDLTQWTRK